VRERRRGFLLLLLRWPLRWDHERTAAEERKEESQAKGRMGLRGQSRAERERFAPLAWEMAELLPAFVLGACEEKRMAGYRRQGLTDRGTRYGKHVFNHSY
jgi:hypothetical protein